MSTRFGLFTIIYLVILSQFLVEKCYAEVTCTRSTLQTSIASCKSSLKYNVFEANSVVTISSNTSPVLQLKATKCGIYKINAGVFTILKLLTHLDLSDNNLSSLAGIETLSGLLSLDISNNCFTTLAPLKIFANHPRLYKIVISENPIDAYNDRIFIGNSDLMSLDMSQNDLTAVPVKLFEKNIQMQNLNMSRNRITALPPNLFIGLTNLKDIDLSENRLMTLPPIIFSKNSLMRNINLSGNRFNNFDIAVFQKTTKLNTLIVSRNRLTNSFWNVTKSLKELIELNVDKNAIDEVYSFVNFPNMTHLSVTCNNIGKLPLDFFSANTDLKKLSIYGNPWKCPCYRMMLTLAENNDVKIIQGYQTNYTYPVCTFVEDEKSCDGEKTDPALWKDWLDNGGKIACDENKLQILQN